MVGQRVEVKVYPCDARKRRGGKKQIMTDSSESEDGLPSFNLKGILSGKKTFECKTVCNCFHLHPQALIPEPQ